jgi:DNA-binding transcriptional regulator YhcF (GntR family)
MPVFEPTDWQGFWDVRRDGEVYLFASPTKEEAWQKFLEDYIANRDKYVALFRKMLLDVFPSPDVFVNKVDMLDRESANLLREKDGGTFRKELAKVVGEETAERIMDEAFKSIVKEGFWKTITDKGIVVLTWKKEENGVFPAFAVYKKEKDKSKTLENFLFFLDEIPYNKGDIWSWRKERLLEEVENCFHEACSLAEVKSYSVEYWEEILESELTNLKWQKGKLGEIIEIDDEFLRALNYFKRGRHIIAEAGAYGFSQYEMDKDKRYAVLFPYDTPDGRRFYKADDAVPFFLTKEDAFNYFKSFVNTGRITYEDFVKDFLSRGYTEEDAKKLALEEYSKYVPRERVESVINFMENREVEKYRNDRGTDLGR